MSKKHKQHDSAESRPANAASSIIDKFEALGNHGVWVVLGIAMLMIAFVYWDFITAAKVLLFKDIGSDSINIFYPQILQAVKAYELYGATSIFSLENVMGGKVGFNPYDLFSWVMVWGGPNNLAGSFANVEMLKALITTTLGYFFFRNQSYTNVASSIGALCFGFSGYIALGASGWYVHSTQVIYIVATLWLIEYGLNKKRLYYVLIPLLTVYIANMTGYLFVYLTAALFVYVPIRVFTTHTGREAFTRLSVLLGLLIVGMALSYNVFTSVVNLVSSSGRTESIRKASAAGNTSAYGTKMDVSIFDLAPRAEYSNIILRAYSNNTMGTGNGFRGMMNYLEAPLLYYGLPMLLFLPFFFVGQDKRTRLVYGILLGAVIMLLVFPWFRFAFWGFNLDYFREYTMLIGAVMLILAIRGLNNFVTIPSKTYTWLAPTTALIVAILPFAFAKPTTLIDPSQKSMLIILILGYGTVATAYAATKRKDILIGLLALTSLDLALNANTTINKRDVLTTAEISAGKLYGGSSKRAIDWIGSQDKSLYRLVKFTPGGPTIHGSLNDAMVQGFNGIVGYSSFHNKYYLRFMQAMGTINLKDPNDAKWVYKAITRPYLASMLGVKYFLVNDNPMGFDPQLFPLVKQIDNVFIHESKTSLPLLVAYESFITEDEFTALPNGRNDYMLYKAAVLAPASSKIGPLTHYNLASDSVRNVSTADFARAAEERKGL
ncbi:MAG: hypothetical protein RLZZ273_1741, partial [Bacteroidota bacterium]